MVSTINCQNSWHYANKIAQCSDFIFTYHKQSEQYNPTTPNVSCPAVVFVALLKNKSQKMCHIQQSKKNLIRAPLVFFLGHCLVNDRQYSQFGQNDAKNY